MIHGIVGGSSYELYPPILITGSIFSHSVQAAYTRTLRGNRRRAKEAADGARGCVDQRVEGKHRDDMIRAAIRSKRRLHRDNARWTSLRSNSNK